MRIQRLAIYVRVILAIGLLERQLCKYGKHLVYEIFAASVLNLILYTRRPRAILQQPMFGELIRRPLSKTLALFSGKISVKPIIFDNHAVKCVEYYWCAKLD